ncbi:MAG: cupin domain-containing protein [Pseudomonadales bacterium]|nr:cupin domain-containing protein [Pseudomonadales bacterium]
MNKNFRLHLLILLLFTLPIVSIADDDFSNEVLLKSKLDRISDTEVIVSRVIVPPNMTLPTHWHPGEEFAYVLSGTVSLSLEGEEALVLKVNELGEVPLKKIHSATAGSDGVELIVFRVHEIGQPERVLVLDNDG